MKRLLFISFSLLALSCTKSQPLQVERKIASWHSCYELLSDIVYHSQKSNGYGSTGFHFSKSLTEVEDLYGDESFFSIQSRVSNQEIKKNNTKLNKLLNEDNGAIDSIEDKVNTVTRTQAQNLYDDMTSTPCVRNDGPYQRPGVSLGYCFGRAIISHFHALRRGVHPESMKKIWVVGPMRGNWGHHVAYMVRGEYGKWFVIDNVTGLVPHDEWIESLKTFKNTSSELMFFVTEANRFGPESSKVYNTVDLFNVSNRNWNQFDRESDYYRGFFRDFFAWLDEQPKPEIFK